MQNTNTLTIKAGIPLILDDELFQGSIKVFVDNGGFEDARAEVWVNQGTVRVQVSGLDRTADELSDVIAVLKQAQIIARSLEVDDQLAAFNEWRNA